MISEVLTFQADPDPCRATNCDMEDSPVSACRERGCGFEWSKSARLDRARRDLVDAQAKARAAGDIPPICIMVDCVGVANEVEVCGRCPGVQERRKEG